jgi:acetolactate synthase regulatory subunit
MSLRPGVRALSSVVSVLHARAADVCSVVYGAHAGGATLTVGLDAAAPEADLLVRQLERRVDVVSVERRGAVFIED